MEKDKVIQVTEEQEKQYIDGLVSKVTVAQRKFAEFSQEQVDYIFRRVALKLSSLRIPLAQMAVEETGMGIVEDKVIKNHFASEYIFNKYKNVKTCGILEEDTANELGEKVSEMFPDCDVEVHFGGQPIYYYVVSVE